MSGIYIPGVEMPREKKTTLTIFPDGRVYENHGERLLGHGEDCIPWKAVPVPPHGDLIDRNALPWEKQGMMLTDPDEWGLKAWDIEHAPTIIPAEEGET